MNAWNSCHWFAPQVFLVAMIHISQHRMAPGQWMPLGIAAMGMVCAATLLA
jgi:hypothetical protein